jgi:hypothetical protein
MGRLLATLSLIAGLALGAGAVAAAPARADGSEPRDQLPAWCAPEQDTEAEPARECCKICRKGKACGDSCIARSKTCRKPPGCACDAE